MARQSLRSNRKEHKIYTLFIVVFCCTVVVHSAEAHGDDKLISSVGRWNVLQTYCN